MGSIILAHILFNKIAVFVKLGVYCLPVCARMLRLLPFIHVEIVTSLDLNRKLLAFSRFTNLRGVVDTFFSDNGSTFCAAFMLRLLLALTLIESYSPFLVLLTYVALWTRSFLIMDLLFALHSC